jgi:predicted aldo/keto reductase-like oxidoreductase
MKKLGFGFMRLPQTDANDWTSIDIEQVKKMVGLYLAKGFRYFDTAYVYHQGVSEGALRQALVERYPRDAFVVADKMPVWLVESPGDYQKYFDEQLTRLGVDYVDYFLLHSLNASRYRAVQPDGFAFLRQLKAAGKIKHGGFSYHDDAEHLDRILTEHPETDFVQLQINYLDWESDTVESRKCYETARKHGTPVIIMEPVKGGALAKLPPEAEQLLRSFHPQLSAASWAIRYAASLEGVLMVLSGMSTLEQVADNTSYMEDFQPLSSEETAILSQVKAIITSKNVIPCTACQYCVEDCPQNIPIPKYFSIFNDHQLFGSPPFYYSTLAETYGKASDCIECKQCEEHCPQHLEISEHMKKLSEVFDVPAAL